MQRCALEPPHYVGIELALSFACCAVRRGGILKRKLLEWG